MPGEIVDALVKVAIRRLCNHARGVTRKLKIEILQKPRKQILDFYEVVKIF